MSDINDARRAALRLFINNADVTEEIQRRIISAAFTDAEDGQADEFTITLADPDGIIVGSWLKKEIEQRAKANKGRASKAQLAPFIRQKNWRGDGKDISLRCGSFALDDVSMQGPPQMVTLRGTACDFNSGLRKTKRTKAWENITLHKLALRITKRDGYALMYLTDKEIKYKRVEQRKQTDAAFLQKLCTRAGLSMKVTNSTVVIFAPKEYESKTETRTIAREDGSYSSYSFQAGLSDTCYEACVVTYEDAETGKIYEGSYPPGYTTTTANSGSDTAYTGKEVDALFTAYYPAKNSMEGGYYDAQGNKLNPSKKTCAAPSSIPFGTKIQVLNTGTSRDGQVYKATDRGGAIKVVNGVYHFDLLMSSAKECNKWGRVKGKALIISKTKSSTKKKSSSTSTSSASTGRDIVDVAIAEIGKVGTYYNKYAKFTGTNGLAWCHAFVSWCADKAGIATSVVPKTASTDTGMKWFKERGRFKIKGSYTPKRGNIIYFKSAGASHVGIVEYVQDGKVHTVEGNASNNVARRKYALNFKKITGYGIPDYRYIKGSGSSVISTTDEEQKILKIANEKVTSNKEARELAIARLREANKGEITATFRLPLDITLCAGLTVKVKGFGGFDGKYYIEQSTHSMDRSGSRTTINLRQVITEY